MNIKIIIATHKQYFMPNDNVYFPLQVGKEINQPLDYSGDDTGENISNKNHTFCELTAIYWAWKNNFQADYIGLAHYRRHFAKSRFGRKLSRIATEHFYKKLLLKAPCILPTKRNYFIESTYNQYAYAHHEEDLIQTRKIISEKYPNFLDAWERVMQSTSGHRFNMFVMRKDIFNNYCEWVFDILFELEKRLDISSYSNYDRRVFGFLSERLLDVYITKENIKYTTSPVVHLENQQWVKKIFNFLYRKFFSTKKIIA